MKLRLASFAILMGLLFLLLSSCVNKDIKKYLLTVSISGLGKGSVVSVPKGIDCKNDCQEKYDKDTKVTLKAAAKAGSQFVKWTGACQTTDLNCEITMDKEKAVSAEFKKVELKQYSLSLSKAGKGHGVIVSTPNGIDCGDTCNASFEEGTKIGLKATASDDSEFVSWSGACSGNESNCSLSIEKDQAVTAEFKLKEASNHNLTVSKTGNGQGVIASIPNGIDCGDTCKAGFEEGAAIILKATASNDSEFVSWSGACKGNTSDCSLTMDRDQTATAEFKLKEANNFNLTVSKTGDGKGSIASKPAGINCGNDCEESFAENTLITLNSLVEKGSRFVKWSGSCSGSSLTCEIKMDANKTVTAEFEKDEAKTYLLQVYKQGAGNGIISSEPSGISCGDDCQERYPEDTTVILTAEAGADSIFEGWEGDFCEGLKPTCTVKLNSNKTATAKFAMTSSGNGSKYYISVSGDDSKDGKTKANAWATFKHADSMLQAGDTLIITDGTYNQKIKTSHFGNAKDGYISYKAEHNFKAILSPTEDTNEATIQVFSCPGCGGGWNNPVQSYISFEGIIARSIGENAAIWLGSADDAKVEEMTNHIIVKNSGFFGSAQETNSAVVDLGNNLRDSLIEDVFAYGKSRKAGIAFGCQRVTVRRAVMRYDYWEGDDYKPNDPRTSFDGYNTQDSIFENIIVIDTAPTPEGYEADRAGFAAAGNETPAALSGSFRNKYLGLIVLNNYGNGIESDGGSGGPNEEIVFKDILSWKNIDDGYAFNVQGNDKGSELSNMTLGESFVGFRLDPYPHAPITHARVHNIFSTRNSANGFYYDEDEVDLFENNTATDNAEGEDLEAKYAPDISKRFLDPVMVPGHERGAIIVNRYVDGNLTDAPLWPYPNEGVIKENMCNPDDLAIAHRVAANGEGWFPGWCATDKTLTEYIWEFNGADCPSDICKY